VVRGLLRAVGALHIDETFLTSSHDEETPRIAAHLAVLNEAAANIGLDIDLDLLTRTRALDQKVVSHVGVS